MKRCGPLFLVRSVLVPAVLALAACQSSVRGELLPVSADVLRRAVQVETTACGFASKTSGAGVILDDGRVLSAAHVVIGATDLVVTDSSGESLPAQILRLDPQADLALLGVPGLAAEPTEISVVEPGEPVIMIGGGPTDPIDSSVLRKVEVRIEGVRSTERVSRVGYELDLRVQLGDSGAGVFDSKGRLAGVVYGRTQAEENRTFVAGRDEILDLLDSQSDGTYACDPDQHRVMRIDSYPD